MSPDNLPTYIPLNQAATRYGVNVAMLRRAVESGIMQAVKVNKEVMVADEDVAVVAAQVEAKDKGDELVSISEAARKLELNPGTVYLWYQNGWLEQRGRGSNRIIFISLQQAKSLADLKKRRGRQGRRLIPKGMDLQGAVEIFT